MVMLPVSLSDPNHPKYYPHFSLWVFPYIFGMTEAIVSKFCTQVGTCQMLVLEVASLISRKRYNTTTLLLQIADKNLKSDLWPI